MGPFPFTKYYRDFSQHQRQICNAMYQKFRVLHLATKLPVAGIHLRQIPTNFKSSTGTKNPELMADPNSTTHLCSVDEDAGEGGPDPPDPAPPKPDHGDPFPALVAFKK